jgi:hypothetical protein
LIPSQIPIQPRPITVCLAPRPSTHIPDTPQGKTPNISLVLKPVLRRENEIKAIMKKDGKKENYFEFKVRLTQNGKPLWALTPEEVVKESLPEQNE